MGPRSGIPPALGRPASGTAFFGRDEILRRIWRLLEFSSLLLLAPRRVGKTSVIKHMHESCEAHGYHTLCLSVAGVKTECDFVLYLLRAFYRAPWAKTKGLRAVFRKLPRDLELAVKSPVLEIKVKGFDGNAPADRLEEVLASAGAGTVLLIDELPLLVLRLLEKDSAARAEDFLNWLKHLRTSYGVRWLFAGSIGLDSLARRHNLSGAIQDLQPVELGAFDAATARAFLMGRAQYCGWTLDAATVDAILNAAEWYIPYYFNLILNEMQNEPDPAPPSPASVERAVAALMHSNRTNFDHWDERLEKHFDARFRSLSNLALNAACVSAKGVAVDTIRLRFSTAVQDPEECAALLKHVLDVLEGEGYLIRTQGAMRFRSALLRRYWKETLAQ